MSEFFICNQDAIDYKLSSLIQNGISDEGWTIQYIDQQSNEQWELTRYHSEYHGAGFRVLKKLPEMSISQLIEIALVSQYMDDITGASLELYEREQYGDENFRIELLGKLQRLEPNGLPEFEKERIKTIIYDTELYDPTNRRNIVGKHYTEIKKDADFYRTVSDGAKRILEQIKNT